MNTVIIPVKDLAAAKVLYGALLGAVPYADEPYYVGFKVDGQDVGLDPNGHSKGLDGPVCYWHVDDLEAHLAAATAAGATVRQQPTHVGGTRRIATLEDGDGNVVGLLSDAPS
jgi:predicted enzyme related to lactoylglutathione lyase